MRSDRAPSRAAGGVPGRAAALAIAVLLAGTMACGDDAPTGSALGPTEAGDAPSTAADDGAGGPALDDADEGDDQEGAIGGASGGADEVEAADEGDEEGADEVEAATAAAIADLVGEDRDGPGCAVAVRHPDGVSTVTHGMADLEAGTAITADTVFDIASVSKQVTGGAVALLVTRGEVDLDTDITTLLPDLPDYPDPITVGDLLHHTSGLPDYIDGLDADLADVTTTADALAVVTDPGWQPTTPPGEVFEYSNTNYLLLAEVVEAVDGRSFVDVVAEEIFTPLGMDPARVRDDQGTLDPGQAQGYALDGDVWEPVGSAWRQTGDGAVHTTVVEMLDWAALFLDDPAPDGLGSTEWLEVMTSPGPVEDDDAGYGAGIGLYDTDDGLLLSHSGSWIGYSSALSVLPDAGVAVAVSCNVDEHDAEGLATDVLDLWS